MDLAIGAKQVFVMMELLTKSGTSKLVNACTYPLTGLGCVSRVYTDLAVFDVGPSGAAVVEMVDGLTLEALRGLTGLQLDMAATPAAVCQNRIIDMTDAFICDAVRTPICRYG